MQFLMEGDSKLYTTLHCPHTCHYHTFWQEYGVISHLWVLSTRFSGGEQKIYT